MKTASVSEAKAHLSRLLALVQAGESVLILSRGKPVARLEAVREPSAAPTALRVEHLVRRGVLRRPARHLVAAGLVAEGGDAASKRGLLASLLLDREEGR